ncbi:MAG: hypothetical protein AMXMBFR13_42130 [Phycisphaerae bacterium]
MHWFWRAAMAVVCGSFLGVAPFAFTHALLARGGANGAGLAASLFSLSVAAVFPVAIYALLTHMSTSADIELSETRCRRCGYILRGISEPRCPECGEKI